MRRPDGDELPLSRSDRIASLRRRLLIPLLLSLAVLACPRDARADDDAANPYFTIGIPLALASTLSDTVQWGVIGTTSASAHWAWHMIPGAGPVVGYQAFTNDHCGPGHDEPQCNLPHAAIQSLEVLYFSCEVAGLVLIGAGLYKRTQPRFPAASSSAPIIIPRLALTRGGMSFGIGSDF
jgi:hypothetical protein